MNWEHLAEDPFGIVFNSHLWRANPSFGWRLETWSSSSSILGLHCRSYCFYLCLKGHCCLSWQQPKNMLMDASSEEGCQTESRGFWLTHGSTGSADRHWRARRTAAIMVIEAKTLETIAKDVWSGSKKFFHTIRWLRRRKNGLVQVILSLDMDLLTVPGGKVCGWKEHFRIFLIQRTCPHKRNQGWRTRNYSPFNLR